MPTYFTDYIALQLCFPFATNICKQGVVKSQLGQNVPHNITTIFLLIIWLLLCLLAHAGKVVTRHKFGLRNF